MKNHLEEKSKSWSTSDSLIYTIAISIIISSILSSWFRPVFPWDSWAYHLPFSAKIWNIGNSASNFVMSSGMQDLYDGFPLFAELIQGGLWFFIGDIKAVTLLNSLSVLFFLIISFYLTRANIPILVFGLFSVPLIALHVTSGYIDLFVAIAISAQVVTATAIEKSLIEKQPKKDLILFCLYIFFSVSASNSKYMAAIVSIIIDLIFISYLFISRNKFSQKRVSIFCIATIIAVFGSVVTPTINYVKHKNPFYPIDLNIKSLNVHLKGTMIEYKNYPSYTEKLGAISRPINWLLSVSELDWEIRGVQKKYTIDSNTGDQPLRYGPVRTGGYWGTLVFTLSMAFIILSIYLKVKIPEEYLKTRFFIINFLLLTIICSFMPQSHELRYYLYWPVLLVFGVGYMASRPGVPKSLTRCFSIVFFVLFILSENMIGFVLNPFHINKEEIMRSKVGSLEIKAAQNSDGVCLGPNYSPIQFMYSSAINGGNHVIEQGWTECKHFTSF